MISSWIIVFREVLEAGLIAGLVLAATKGLAHRIRWVLLGVAGGITGAGILALFATQLAAAFSGDGQEVFNATVLILAVGMLAWHNLWMASHGKVLAQEANAIGSAIAQEQRPIYALAIVVGVAVLREGAEVVVFLYGIFVSGGQSLPAMAAGSALGILSGILVAMLLYMGLLRIPMRYLFKITSWLIAFLAAGMAAQAVAFLSQAGLISIGTHIVWNSSALLSDNTMTGRVFHVLLGYTDRPTEIQLVVYLAVLLVISGAGQFIRAGSATRINQAVVA